MNTLTTIVLAASMAAAVPPAPSASTNLKAEVHRVVAERIRAVAPAAAAHLPVGARRVPRRQRSTSAIVAGAVLGAGAGFLAGGYIGYQFDRGFHDCGCDDPGIIGIVYGAPIGAVVGGILGGKFLFR